MAKMKAFSWELHQKKVRAIAGTSSSLSRHRDIDAKLQLGFPKLRLSPSIVWSLFLNKIFCLNGPKFGPRFFKSFLVWTISWTELNLTTMHSSRNWHPQTALNKSNKQCMYSVFGKYYNWRRHNGRIWKKKKVGGTE